MPRASGPVRSLKKSRGVRPSWCSLSAAATCSPRQVLFVYRFRTDLPGFLGVASSSCGSKRHLVLSSAGPKTVTYPALLNDSDIIELQATGWTRDSNTRRQATTHAALNAVLGLRSPSRIEPRKGLREVRLRRSAARGLPLPPRALSTTCWRATCASRPSAPHVRGPWRQELQSSSGLGEKASAQNRGSLNPTLHPRCGASCRGSDWPLTAWKPSAQPQKRRKEENEKVGERASYMQHKVSNRCQVGSRCVD